MPNESTFFQQIKLRSMTASRYKAFYHVYGSLCALDQIEMSPQEVTSFLSILAIWIDSFAMFNWIDSVQFSSNIVADISGIPRDFSEGI